MRCHLCPVLFSELLLIFYELDQHSLTNQIQHSNRTMVQDEIKYKLKSYDQAKLNNTLLFLLGQAFYNESIHVSCTFKND